VLGVDGLPSGIDTTSIINQLMDVARSPIRSMQATISRLQQRKAAMQEMNTLLADLQAAVEAVDSASELGSFGATSSQPDSLGVSVVGDVQPGMHTVEVVALAENTVIRSAGLAAPDETLRRGTLTLTIDGNDTDVPIEDAEGTRTPEGLVAYINDNVDGVHAYLLDTGSGSTPYRLMIEGDDTGEVNRVTFDVSYQGGGGRRISPSIIRQGDDAQLTIDATTVYTASNTPTDLIPGLQLDLKNTTAGDARVTTSRDTAAMAEKVESVVAAYNKLHAFVEKQSDTTDPGPLSGDATVRTISRRLQTVLSSSYGNASIAGLNTLGIKTTQEGVLEFDSAAFSTASGNDFAATLDVLTGSGGLFGAMQNQLDLITDTTTGIIQPRLDSYDSQITALNDKIDGSQFRLEQYEDSLRQQFTAMETILAQYQATGDYLAAQLAALNNNNS
jgi:flagellar hook-associated protein 2